jgi:hypothetical protein
MIAVVEPVPEANSPVADFTIVVPTYNERDRIGVLLEGVFAACDGQGIAVEVVIVDDNSADGTGAIADEWARHGRVRVIHRSGKLGLGTAVLEGFAAARTDIVGVMDGDLSHPPELLPTLFRTIGEGNFDVVVASRYVSGGATINFPIGRWMLSRLGCWLARPLTPVHDSMSGFFLIRRRRLDGFRTSVQGFKIGLELLVRSEPRRLAEVGYVFVGRTVGASKMSFGEASGFLRQLIALYRHAVASPARRPAHVTVATGEQCEVSASWSRASGANRRQRSGDVLPSTAGSRPRAIRHSGRPPSTAMTTEPADMLKPYETARSSAVAAAAVGTSTPNATSAATRPPSTGPRPASPGTTPPSIATTESVASCVGDNVTPNARVAHSSRSTSWAHNSVE